MMRFARPLSILLVLVATTTSACGGDNSEPFGDVSDADQARAESISQRSQQISSSYAQFISAFSNYRLRPARRSLNGVFEAIDQARTEIDAVENDDFRSRFGVYLDAVEDLADASDRWLSYYEAPGSADSGAEAQLRTDFERAARKLEREDRALLDTLLESASPERRDEIRKNIREAQKQFEEEANSP